MTYVAFDDKMNMNISMNMAVCSSVHHAASRGHVEVVKILSEYVSNGRYNKMKVNGYVYVHVYACTRVYIFIVFKTEFEEEEEVEERKIS